VTARQTCSVCGHEDHATELYAQAGPGVPGGAWFCRNHNSCQTRMKTIYANRKERTVTTPEAFDWNNPEYRNSEYWKWETPGDTVTGIVTAIGTHTFPAKQNPDGTTTQPKTVPVITVDDGGGQVIEVTCSNADLLDQIRKAAPQVGDKISMEYLRDIPTSFGGKKKLFNVKHKRAEGSSDPWAKIEPKTDEPIQSEVPF